MRTSGTGPRFPAVCATLRCTVVVPALLAVLAPAARAEEVRPRIRGRPLPPAARAVLREIMRDSGVRSVRVTSARRTPAGQARAMYRFARRHGLAAARELYGPEGQAVLAVYARCRRGPQRRCLRLMREEVERVLPAAHAGGRLMHTAPTHHVFDLSWRALPRSRRAAFVAAARSHPHVSRVLGPADGERGAVHIEIPRAPPEDVYCTNCYDSKLDRVEIVPDDR